MGLWGEGWVKSCRVAFNLCVHMCSVMEWTFVFVILVLIDCCCDAYRARRISTRLSTAGKSAGLASTVANMPSYASAAKYAGYNRAGNGLMLEIVKVK